MTNAMNFETCNREVINQKKFMKLISKGSIRKIQRLDKSGDLVKTTLFPELTSSEVDDMLDNNETVNNNMNLCGAIKLGSPVKDFVVHELYLDKELNMFCKSLFSKKIVKINYRGLKLEDRREPDDRGVFTIEMITEDGATGKTIECLAITRELFESELANGSAEVDDYNSCFQEDTLQEVLKVMLTAFGSETIRKPCLDISLNKDISENLAALMSEKVTGHYRLKTLEALIAVGESHLIVIDPLEVIKFIG